MTVSRAFGHMTGFFACLALAGCAMMPVTTAEKQCARAEREARPVSGTAAFGIGSGGRNASKVELNLSTSGPSYHRDPAAAYEACVIRKSGQPPSRPLYMTSDWKG